MNLGKPCCFVMRDWHRFEVKKEMMVYRED